MCSYIHTRGLWQGFRTFHCPGNGCLTNYCGRTPTVGRFSVMFITEQDKTFMSTDIRVSPQRYMRNVTTLCSLFRRLNYEPRRMKNLTSETVTQLVKNSRLFIKQEYPLLWFKTSHQWTLLCTTSIQSTHYNNFFKIHFNSILRSTPLSSTWFLPFRD
jgi:hypothetical protein